MMGIIRVVVFGMLSVATILHVVGFATPSWFVGTLHFGDALKVSGMKTDGISEQILNQVGASQSIGLWRYCSKSNIAQIMGSLSKADISGMTQDHGVVGHTFGENTDGDTEASEGQNNLEDWNQQGSSDTDGDTDNNFGSMPNDMSAGDTSEFGQETGQEQSFSLPEMSNSMPKSYSSADMQNDMNDIGLTLNECANIDPDVAQDWMKAVQALGIIAMIAAVLALALTIYSCVGDGKGDRARLMPYIIGGVSLFAGVVVLIGAIVFASKIYDLMATLTQSVEDIVQKNTSLGYSFALECVAGLLYILACLLFVVSARREFGSSTQFGGSRNMAV